MYKLMTLGTLLIGLALAPALSEAERATQPSENAGSAQIQSQAAKVQTTPVVEPVSCEWSCRACEPGEGCLQTCTEIGDCGSTCDTLTRCDAEHVWSENSCACEAR